MKKILSILILSVFCNTCLVLNIDAVKPLLSAEASSTLSEESSSLEKSTTSAGPQSVPIIPKFVDVLFVGDSGSGKTWLRDALIHNGTTTDVSYLSTRKVNFFIDLNHPINVNGQIFHPRYWDTPGHPSVRDQLLTEGVRECQIVVITIDISSIVYGAAPNIYVVERALVEWAMTIHEKAPKVRIILAGTKKDLVTFDDYKKVLKRFKEITGEGLVSLQGQDYVVTSATSDPASVLQIKDIIQNRLVNGDIDLTVLQDASGPQADIIKQLKGRKLRTWRFAI